MSANEEVLQASRKRTRRSFLGAGVAALGGYEFYRWIDRAPGVEMQPSPLRKAFDVNAEIARGVFRLCGDSPTYPMSKAENLRINGDYGLKQDLLLDSYRLQVVGVQDPKRFPQYADDVTAWNYRYKTEEAVYSGHDTKEAPKAQPAGASSAMLPQFTAAFAAMKAEDGGKQPRGQEEAGESDSTLDPGTPGLLLKLEDLNKFKKQDLVTQFKCIEGWSQIVHWAGVPLRDFIEAYPPARDEHGKLPKYVYMETPNGDYYCGFNLEDCLHPQSLLVTEMSGKPIEPAHGAPIRLHMPIKYGYKQIKRIGLIAYTDDKPDDYWTKLGYDWYAGL